MCRFFQYQILIGLAMSVFFGFTSQQEDFSTDASDITWAHAVNSKRKLNDSLKGDVMFLEADVSLGRSATTNTWEEIPIMAHPPLKYSDISLEEWIYEVISRGNNSKGVKLDFKSTKALNVSLSLLEKWKDQISFPLWLNADILPGPVNATATPVDAETFFRLCRRFFPRATLSIGWTTANDGFARPEDLRYSWNDVWTMARAIRCAEIGNDQPLSFPIRAIFVENSIPQLLWLVRTFPSSSLTIWTGIFDHLKLETLLDLRRQLPLSKVYYDLPLDMDTFNELKQNVSYEKSRQEGLDWGSLRDSNEPYGCDDATSAVADTILYGGRRTAAIFHSLPFFLPLSITGKLYPYDIGDYNGEFSTREGVMTLVVSKTNFWVDGKWVEPYNSSLLAIGVGDPDHIQSCCSVNFAVNLSRPTFFDDDASSHTTRDFTVQSCHHHESCKIYTDHSDSELIVKESEYVYVGLVFKGERALVVTDIKINGNQVSFTSGSSRHDISNLGLAVAMFWCVLMKALFIQL